MEAYGKIAEDMAIFIFLIILQSRKDWLKCCVNLMVFNLSFDYVSERKESESKFTKNQDAWNLKIKLSELKCWNYKNCK